MFQILRSIYDRSVAIVFGTAFFGTFWRLRKLIFWWQNFQILIFMFSFYPCNSRTGSRKTSMTQEWLVIESSLTPCWVKFLIFCQLVLQYNLSFEWFWAEVSSYSYAKKFSQQNSRLVHEMFPFLKQAVSVILFLDLLIVIEFLLQNWKEM